MVEQCETCDLVEYTVFLVETCGSCDGHGDHDEVGVNILWRVEADDYLDVLL